MKALLVTLAVISLSILDSVNTVIVIKPNRPNEIKTALIFLTQEPLNEKIYQAPLLQLANKSELWIAIKSIWALPSGVKPAINETIDILLKSGLSDLSQVWLGGHSKAADILQDVNLKDSMPTFKLAGLILLNSYLKQSNYDNFNSLPVLTIGGELDGLVRVTKFAESSYFDSELSRMTFIIEGMNHFQFCGQKTSFDFKAEISDSQAIDKITSMMAAFINVNSDRIDNDSIAYLKMNAALTKIFTEPIITALKLEGSPRIQRTCEKNVTNQENCTRGSDWSVRANEIMAGSGVKLIATDNWLGSVPVELPSIENKCSGLRLSECVLNVTSMSALVYSDDESGPSGAIEIRTKLMSRQALLLAFTGIKFEFNETDQINNCAEINDQSIEWAIEKASEKARHRYLSFGRLMRTGKDIGPLNMGPLWIYTPLKYESINDKSGNFTQIRSGSLNTPVDFWIQKVAAFHYCKVLSPARALEWIYYDSLLGQTY